MRWHRTNFRAAASQRKIFGFDFHLQPDKRIEPGTAEWEVKALPLCHLVPSAQVGLKKLFQCIYIEKQCFISDPELYNDQQAEPVLIDLEEDSPPPVKVEIDPEPEPVAEEIEVPEVSSTTSSWV